MVTAAAVPIDAAVPLATPSLGQSFARLLETLGMQPDDRISLGHRASHDDDLDLWSICLVKDAAAVVRPFAEQGHEVYYGVNPLSGDAVPNPGERGKAHHVARITSLYADLDSKPKPQGLGSEAECRAVVAEVSAALGGNQPAVVVQSGSGGLHAYWLLEQHAAAEHPRAVQLLHRFRLLVRAVASHRGGSADNVQEPARVLRVPGTLHQGTGAEVVAEFIDDDGAETDRLSLDALEEYLSEAGIPDEPPPTGKGAPGEGEQTQAPMQDWPLAAETCSYARVMMDGWATDSPGARHPWMLSQAVRLLTLLRRGCITREDFSTAEKALSARFAALCGRKGDPRPVKPHEVSGAFVWAQERVENTALGVLWADVGGPKHDHADGYGGSTEGGMDSTSEQRGTRQLQVTRGSAMTMKRVEWAWRTESGGRFPAGELAIVAGPGGRGKSTYVNRHAAMVTRGEVPGNDYGGRPRSVIISATEESWETTILPKLAVAGADLSRVLKVETLVYVKEAGRSVSVGLNLAVDITQLETLMKAEDVGLLVLDPIISRLGKLDTHKDAEVRVALDPLVEVLHNTNAVAIGIMHFNKGDGSPMKLLMGSTAFGAVARSVHVVEKDPDNPGERLFATVKANMGRDDLPMLRFRLEEKAVTTPNGDVLAPPIAVDLGEDFSGRSFEDVQRRMRRDALAADRQASGVRTVIDEACDFLAEWTRAHDFVGKSADIKAAAKERDIPEMTLKRARARMGIEVSSREGFGGGTCWSWPQGAVPGGSGDAS